jgi:hypothetical protein
MEVERRAQTTGVAPSALPLIEELRRLVSFRHARRGRRRAAGAGAGGTAAREASGADATESTTLDPESP